MSCSTQVFPYRTSFELRLTWLKPAARMAAEGLKWVGGSLLFAATVYVMAALPGLID